MVRAVAPRLLPAVIVVLASVLMAAQEPPRLARHDSLTAAQRRLLDGWASGQYDAAPAAFRVAFEEITALLSSLVLSDPENGEVLGAALDLVASVEPIDQQPAAGAASSPGYIAVTLASGARDRLRRSGEFERARDGAPDRVEFLHAGPPAIRISMDASGARARISVQTR